ncbi:GMC family oxidoreductase N-terminal domain-containing protein [Siccirubricoccus deserti]
MPLGRNGTARHAGSGLRHPRRRLGRLRTGGAAFGRPWHEGGAAGGRPLGPQPLDPHPDGLRPALRHPQFDWKYQTEGEKELGGRSVYWPRGRVVGGSGSVNGLVFLRGSPRDYDRWAQSGARGWSYEDCLPAFRKLETFHGPESEYRGKSGPMQIAEVPAPTPGCRAFLDTCQALGFARNPDNNGEWFEGWRRTSSTSTGAAAGRLRSATCGRR